MWLSQLTSPLPKAPGQRRVPTAQCPLRAARFGFSRAYADSSAGASAAPAVSSPVQTNCSLTKRHDHPVTLAYKGAHPVELAGGALIQAANPDVADRLPYQTRHPPHRL